MAQAKDWAMLVNAGDLEKAVRLIQFMILLYNRRVYVWAVAGYESHLLASRIPSKIVSLTFLARRLLGHSMSQQYVNDPVPSRGKIQATEPAWYDRAR